SSEEPDVPLACLLAFHAITCSYTGQIEKLESSYQKSLAILRRLDDSGDQQEVVHAFYLLGSSLRYIRPHEAQVLLDECIVYSRKHNYLVILAKALGNRFSFGTMTPQDIPVFEEMIRLNRQIDDQRGVAVSYLIRGLAAYRFEGDPVMVQGFLTEAITLYRRSDDPFNLAITLTTFAIIAHDQGNLPEAKLAFLEALRHYDIFGGLP